MEENIPHKHRRQGLPKNFFCNPNAYGQFQKDRNEAQDGKFWKLCQTVAWPDPSWPEFPIPFITLWNWLEKVKVKHPQLCPAMGKLSMYMLAADMCAAGLVHAPTVQDLGPILKQLNAGGVGGLRMLGYLSENTFSKQDVTAAFGKFFDEVEQSLTAVERTEMPWNTIVAEHTLLRFLKNEGSFQFRLGSNGSRETATPNPPKRGN